MDEFELIRRYFASQSVVRDDVRLGIGDDGAVMDVPHGAQLVTTTDTLVAGRHFPPDTDAAAVGHKLLAVGLSDLAAMGAEPAWVTVALALPCVDQPWLAGFSRGFFELARRYRVQLVGGDTVRGPLAATAQVHGLVPADTALRRAGASVGDTIFVTGTLGDAGLALAQLRGRLVLPAADAAAAKQRLDWPQPRVDTGLALRGVASAAIDLSDGLAADLGALAAASGVGARVELSCLPLSAGYRDHFSTAGGWSLAVAHGDDYELCFTVPPGRLDVLSRRVQEECCWTRIGVVETAPGVRLMDADGQEYRPARAGFNHFAPRP